MWLTSFNCRFAFLFLCSWFLDVLWCVSVQVRNQIKVFIKTRSCALDFGDVSWHACCMCFVRNLFLELIRLKWIVVVVEYRLSNHQKRLNLRFNCVEIFLFLRCLQFRLFWWLGFLGKGCGATFAVHSNPIKKGCKIQVKFWVSSICLSVSSPLLSARNIAVTEETIH